jgi:myo-inositol-1(or 4)-monophosphatase
VTDDRSDVEVAIAAAQAGAAVLMDTYGTALEQDAKSATDFATAADVASERAILDIIRRARTDDGFVGEELGEVGRGSRVWLVDPLCGTLNFATRTTTFSVNVDLVQDDATTAAAVSHPPSGEVHWAADGSFGMLGREGATTTTPNRLVDINADGPLDRPFVGAQLAADPDLRGQFSPRVESTTLALAWVATGQRLAYVTDGMHQGSVHFTAGIALCEAAGCVVTDFDGNAVHTGPGIVAAADAETHTTLLALIARYRAR